MNTKRWFITSNLKPEEWYAGLDDLTFGALKRRLSLVIHKLSAFDLMMPMKKIDCYGDKIPGWEHKELGVEFVLK